MKEKKRKIIFFCIIGTLILLSVFMFVQRDNISEKVNKNQEFEIRMDANNVINFLTMKFHNTEDIDEEFLAEIGFTDDEINILKKEGQIDLAVNNLQQKKLKEQFGEKIEFQ